MGSTFSVQINIMIQMFIALMLLLFSYWVKINVEEIQFSMVKQVQRILSQWPQKGDCISFSLMANRLMTKEAYSMETKWLHKSVLLLMRKMVTFTQEQALVSFISGQETCAQRTEKFMKDLFEGSNGLMGSCFLQEVKTINYLCLKMEKLSKPLIYPLMQSL